MSGTQREGTTPALTQVEQTEIHQTHSAELRQDLATMKFLYERMPEKLDVIRAQLKARIDYIEEVLHTRKSCSCRQNSWARIACPLHGLGAQKGGSDQ